MRAYAVIRRGRVPDEQCRARRPRRDLFGDPSAGRRSSTTNLWGVIHGVQVFAPRDDRAEDARRDRQHRLEAGDHLPARRHRLQRLEAGVKVVTDALAHELRNIEGCRGYGASPHPRFTFTGITARERREAGRRLDGRSGDRLHAGEPGERRLLHPLPDNDVTRQWTRSGCAWASATSIRTAPPLSALASRLHRMPFAEYPCRSRDTIPRTPQMAQSHRPHPSSMGSGSWKMGMPTGTSVGTGG